MPGPTLPRPHLSRNLIQSTTPYLTSPAASRPLTNFPSTSIFFFFFFIRFQHPVSRVPLRAIIFARFIWQSATVALRFDLICFLITDWTKPCDARAQPPGTQPVSYVLPVVYRQHRADCIT